MDHHLPLPFLGPRELGGDVDLVSQYKLWPHHEIFCKRSLPLSISESHYLQNVVGDTQIRKGEGMELDKLFCNAFYLRERNACIHPFDLGELVEAFHIRETTPVDLTSAERGISTAVMKSSSKSTRDKQMKHKKHTVKDQKKHKLHNKDGSHKDRNRRGVEPGLENFKKQPDKRRRYNGLYMFSDNLNMRKPVMSTSEIKNVEVGRQLAENIWV